LEIFIFLAEILIEGGSEECLSYALNFMTFGNTCQKLWPNMLLFLRAEQFGQIFKNQFFQKLKFEIDFFNLIIHRMLSINESKVMRSLGLQVVMDSLHLKFKLTLKFFI